MSPADGGAQVPPSGMAVPPSGKQPKPKGKGPIIAIIAAVLVIVLVAVAGAGYWFFWRKGEDKPAGEPAPTAQEAKPDQKADTAESDSSKETEPAKPKVTEVTLGEVPCDATDWKWHAGVMATGVGTCSGTDSYSVNVWIPGSETPKPIEFSLLEEGEKMFGDGPEIAATYGDEPAVFVIYDVKTKASGTDPETVHLYAQQIDVEDGTLGERIDLKTESDNVINYEDGYKHQVIASSDDGVLVAKQWESDGTDHVGLMRLRAGAASAEEVRTIDRAEVDDPNPSSGETVVYPGIRDGMYLTRDSSYHLRAVDDDKELTKFPIDFCDEDGGGHTCSVTSYFRLKEGSYVVHHSDSYGSDAVGTVLVDASGNMTRLSSLIKGSSKPEGLTQLSDGSLTFRMASDDGPRLFMLSTDFTPTEVLSAAQWKRLFSQSYSTGFKAVNYLAKEFYVQTTDESIVVDETGESVGTYTVPPASEDKVGDTDHTAVKWIAWWDPSMTYRKPVVTTGKAPAGTAESADSSGSSSDDSSGSSSKGSGSSDSDDSSSSKKSSD